MNGSRRLTLYHFAFSFAVFLAAIALGAWQMFMRSPLPAPLDDPALYYESLTLHGTIMAYAFPTFFAMGFGYAIAATTLDRPLIGRTAAWIGFVICAVGALMAVITILAGKATSSTPSIHRFSPTPGITWVPSS